MATTTIKLFPLSPLPKQTNSSLTSCLSCKPISYPLASLPLSHQRGGNVAVSVSFNPQGNFDVSLFDDGNIYFLLISIHILQLYEKCQLIKLKSNS